MMNMASPADFEIKIIGSINESLSEYFGEFSIELETKNNQNISCLKGEILDQAALIGLLNLLYDMRFPILSVRMLKAKTEKMN